MNLLARIRAKVSPLLAPVVLEGLLPFPLVGGILGEGQFVQRDEVFPEFTVTGVLEEGPEGSLVEGEDGICEEGV